MKAFSSNRRSEVPLIEGPLLGAGAQGFTCDLMEIDGDDVAQLVHHFRQSRPEEFGATLMQLAMRFRSNRAGGGMPAMVTRVMAGRDSDGLPAYLDVHTGSGGAGAAMPDSRTVALRPDQIVVSRQALLDIVRALDFGGTASAGLPAAMDSLREPFFSDEMSSGTARVDFSVNKYDFARGPG